MKAIRVFISHWTGEANNALCLERTLKQNFPSMRIFLSSNPNAIDPGDRFLDKIHAALKGCSVLLVLCSKESIGRPWTNIETGAAWILKKRIISLCLPGLRFDDLPQHLALDQAIDVTSSRDLEALFVFLGKKYDIGIEESPTPATDQRPRTRANVPARMMLRDDTEMVWNRMRELFLDGQRDGFKWLYVELLARQCGISEGRAMAMLRRHWEVIIDKNGDNLQFIAALEQDNANPRGRQDLVNAGYDVDRLPDDVFVWCRMYDIMQGKVDVPDYFYFVEDRLAWHGGVGTVRALRVLRQHLDQIWIDRNREAKRWACRLRQTERLPVSTTLSLPQ